MLQKSTLISATVGVVWGALLASTCVYFITRPQKEEPFSYLPKITEEGPAELPKADPLLPEPTTPTAAPTTPTAAPAMLALKAEAQRRTIVLTFSTNRKVLIKPGENLLVEPAVTNLSAYPNYWNDTMILRGDFEPETEYTLTLKEGMQSIIGEQLVSDTVFTVKTLPPEPHANFLLTQGQMALTPETSLPFTYLACDKLKIEVWKAFPNNLVHYGQAMSPDHLMELHASHVFTLPRNNKKPQNALLPVYDLVKGMPGAYCFRVFLNENDEDDADHCFVILSNIGATYAYDKRGLPIVSVLNLVDGSPIADASATLYDDKYQLIALGISDELGFVETTLTPEAAERKGPLTPKRMIITAGDDITLMEMNSETWHSAYLPTGITRPAFPASIWPDRDAIHPGEKVQLYGVVRDAAVKAVKDLPLTLEVHSPANKLFLSDEVTSNQDGYFTTSFTMPDGIRDGYYTVYCKLGKETLATTDLYVADFTPNHVQIGLEFKDKPEDPCIPLKLSAKTYFGTTVSQGNGTYQIKAEPATLPEAWKGWTIGINESSATIASASFTKDCLEETIQLTTLRKEILPIKHAPIRVTATVTFSEPNNRAVVDSASLTLAPKTAYLAMRYDEDTQAIAFRQFVPEGAEPTEAVITTFSLVEHRASYELVKDSNSGWRYKWVSFDQNVKLNVDNPPIDPKPLTLTYETVQKSVSNLPPGHYTLMAALSDGTQTRISFWHNTSWEGKKLGHTSNLTFTADKQHYNPGETALLTFYAPVKGRAIVTGGDDTLQQALAFEVEAGKVTLPIPIAKNTIHGTWTVGVTLVAKNLNTEARYFGVAELDVSHAHQKLAVTLDAPKVMRPQETLTLNLNLTTPAGEPCRGTVAIFAVDEAVLNVTGFKTPDPHTDIYSYTGHPFIFGDLYGTILPQLRLLPDGRIGGGKLLQARRKMDNSVNAQQLTTTLILPLQEVDDSGKLTLPIQLPDFKGTLRIMAVAANKDIIGSTSTQVIVRTPASLSVAGVRYGCAGDQAESSFRIINHDLPTSPYTLTVGEHTFTGEIATGATLYHAVTLPVGERTATLKIGEFTTSVTQKVAIQDEVPMHAEVQVKVLKEGETLPQDAELLSSIHHMRKLALDWLKGYPYSCTEQLSACILPYTMSQDPNERVLVKAYYNRLAARLSTAGEFYLWDDCYYVSDVASLFASQVLIEGVNSGILSKEHLPNVLTRLYYMATSTKPDERPQAAYAAFLLGEAGAHKHALHAARNLLVANEHDTAGFVAAATLVLCGAADEGAPKMKANLAANPFPKPLFTSYMGHTASQAMTLYFAIRAGVIDDAEIDKRIVQLLDQQWDTTQTCMWVARALQLCEDRDIETRYRQAVPTTRLQNDAQIRVTKQIVDREGNPITTLKHGELAFVKIQVQHPRKCDNLILCDRLPGGLEYEDANLATRESVELPQWAQQLTAFNLQSQENTGAQIRFFGSDVMLSFTHVYPVRATTKGTFAIPAALIEDMYVPSYNGGHDPVETLTIQ